MILEESAISAIGEILMLEDHRRFDEATLRGLADHPSEEVRRRAATAAGRIGDAAAAPLLLTILREDPSPTVRADAAFALGLLGDTSAAVVRGLRSAAPPRWRPVREEETTVVVEVVAALAKLGTPEALQMLKDALRDAYPARDPHSRRIAAEALVGMHAFRTAPGRVTSVAPFLDLEDAELRWRAAWTLFRIRDPAAVSHLVSRVGDEEHRVRAFAARGLSAPLADSAGRRADALAALTGALEDRHPHVRINALGSLGGYGERAPRDAMAALIHDPDSSVGVAAARAIA
ncbi:MAG: HEAT repeat domain-containing protein, partial [Gemmatimonadetes bacterium]|nr:HEAT repeat domain-containing protein [Gemmatimonadota bacterium]